LKNASIHPDWRHTHSITSVNEAEWDKLAGDNPFTRHTFLRALESSGCVGADSGWEPFHLIGLQGTTLLTAAPLYLKWHSYGEYVFDYVWAHAFASHGLNYYPKLVCAVPFTPITGPRLMARSEPLRQILAQKLAETLQNNAASSLHALFVQKKELEAWVSAGFHVRTQIQFCWQNEDFTSFADFLKTLRHDKRKKIQQERKKLLSAGITFEYLEGPEIAPPVWEFFHQCYLITYKAHASMPYLNLDFFKILGQTMPDSIRLILVKRAGKPIASSLFFTGGRTLYGRHWGAIENWPGLHFETCYYQAIEYAIREKLEKVEAGVQGEHKLARGYTPHLTYSVHRMTNPDFDLAVHNWLDEERRIVSIQNQSLLDRTPFRIQPSPDLQI